MAVTDFAHISTHNSTEKLKLMRMHAHLFLSCVHFYRTSHQLNGCGLGEVRMLSVWHLHTVLWHSITLTWKMGNCGSWGGEAWKKKKKRNIWAPTGGSDPWHISAVWYLTDRIERQQCCWHCYTFCSRWLSSSSSSSQFPLINAEHFIYLTNAI